MAESADKTSPEKTLSEITEEVRKGVKRHRGAINEIAKRAKRHRDWVWRVLTGKYEDLNVLRTAALVVEEFDKSKSEMRADILKSHERAGKYAPQF